MIHAPVANLLLVIHGTFAAGQSWWRWPSPFTQHLDALTGGAVYKGADAFAWSGGNSDADRETAASDLVVWVQTHPANDLTIVAHSHGGNVAMLATRLATAVAISRLILLGTPIRTDYTPDVRRIGVLYNVYSFGDYIQKPGAAPHRRGEGRTLGDSERVVNFLARNGVFGPGHADLHDAAVWHSNGFDQLVL